MPTNQLQKDNWIKMYKKFEQTCLKRRYMNGQRKHERMLSIVSQMKTALGYHYIVTRIAKSLNLNIKLKFKH